MAHMPPATGITRVCTFLGLWPETARVGAGQLFHGGETRLLCRGVDLAAFRAGIATEEPSASAGGMWAAETQGKGLGRAWLFRRLVAPPATFVARAPNPCPPSETIELPLESLECSYGDEDMRSTRRRGTVCGQRRDASNGLHNRLVAASPNLGTSGAVQPNAP